MCTKGDACSFRHDESKRTTCSSSPTPKSQTNKDRKSSSKATPPRGRQSTWKKARRLCKDCPEQTCTKPSRDSWHPPVCQNYKSQSGCKFGETWSFLHREADRQPSKRPKKGGGKGSAALLKNAKRLGCILQSIGFFFYEALRPKRCLQFKKSTSRFCKILERKCPSLGVYAVVVQDWLLNG